MAIKFGDILQNQNSAYPIVEASNNDIKGVIFSTALPSGSDFPNKRALGTILVDTSADKMYFYKGSDLSNGQWGTNSNWEVLATGTGETIQSTNLPVSIPSGRSFGRFISGQTINVGGGKNAIDIIKDAITSYVAPLTSFSGNDTEVAFDTVSQNVNHTVTFGVTNSNQQVVAGTTATSAYAIREIKLFRKLDGGSYSEIANATPSVNDFDSGTFDDLNTAGTVTEVTFTFNDTVTAASGSNDFIYKVEVTPNLGDGTATTAVDAEGVNENSGFIDCAGYVAPTITSDTIAKVDSVVASNETGRYRERGNVASKLDITLNNPNSLVPITGIKLERSYDNSTWDLILNQTSLSLTGSTTRKYFDSVATSGNNNTGLNNVPSGYTVVTSAIAADDRDEDQIYYRIKVTTDQATDAILSVDQSVELSFPGIVGQSTVDGSAFTSSDNSTMSTVMNACVTTSTKRFAIKLLDTSGVSTESGDPSGFGSVAINTTTGNSNNSQAHFLYIAFPAGFNPLDQLQISGASNVVSSLGGSPTEAVPKSTTVQVTTHFGIVSPNSGNEAYEVYCANSAGAHNGTYQIS
jgi:hypothetical protein